MIQLNIQAVRVIIVTCLLSVEISKLPCFDVEIPDECTTLWRERYEEYKKDMTMAMNSGCEVKNSACNEVIKKYKKVSFSCIRACFALPLMKSYYFIKRRRLVFPEERWWSIHEVKLY